MIRWIPAVLLYLWFGWHYADTLVRLSKPHASATERRYGTLFVSVVWPLALLMQLAVHVAAW